MFSNNSIPSLSDIAAVTNNDGFGGNNGAWWIIILFLFAFCGWGNNGGGLFGGGGATGSGITDGYILTSDFASLERQMDNGFDGIRQQGTSIANGISSLGYDQLGQMNGINQNINNATNNITSQITALGTQMAQCCCDNRYQSATQSADLNYRLAEQSCQTRQAIADSTAAITANQDANTRSILEFMTQDKIASLQAENQSLKLAASQAAQNNYLIGALSPTPRPAYIVQSPYAAYNGCGCACSV